jgi:hypothetical protein
MASANRVASMLLQALRGRQRGLASATMAARSALVIATRASGSVM